MFFKRQCLHVHDIGRTTDIAIWSTVEVGVGIVAGCAATLRPLLKLVLTKVGLSASSGQGSNMPWSQSNPHQRSRYQHNIGLDDMRRDAVTTTTIVAEGSSKPPKHSIRTLRGQGSDEELIGINKSVVVTYSEAEVEPTTSSKRDRDSITGMSD